MPPAQETLIFYSSLAAGEDYKRTGWKAGFPFMAGFVLLF